MVRIFDPESLGVCGPMIKGDDTGPKAESKYSPPNAAPPLVRDDISVGATLRLVVWKGLSCNLPPVVLPGVKESLLS